MNTPLLRRLVSLAAGLALAAGLSAQTPKLQFPDASPAATVIQRVGLTNIEVHYSRPGMKGREIFGGLVPFDQVWRTGANSATKVSFSTAVKLNGTPIPAGTYELFTIPGRTEWTIIIHKDMSLWGAYDYQAKDDVARFSAEPFPLPLSVENFTINFNRLRDDSALMELVWDKTLVPIHVTVDTVAALVPQIEAVMKSDAPKKPYDAAALFYLNHDLDLSAALGWINTTLAAHPDSFELEYHKGLIQEKMGDKAGALASAQACVAGAAKAEPVVGGEYTRLAEGLIARLNGTPAPEMPAARPARAHAPRAASTGGLSPHETISAVIGERRSGTRITITYGRPYTIKPGTTEVRKIWGGLVPWGQADRLGADEATTLITPAALEIGGTTIPAGAYTLYLIPSESGVSQLAFSTNLGKWGVPVDETHDLARVDLKKEALPETVGQLTLGLANDRATGGGVLTIRWENTQFSLPFTIRK